MTHLFRQSGLAACVLFLLGSVPAQAEQIGRVTMLSVRSSDGLIHFELDGARGPRPACAEQHGYWVIRNENSDTGKRQYAMLLAARATGQVLTVTGAGVCDRWADGESVNSINW